MKSKVANENGSRQIMYLVAGMGPGLRILVSAVQSRPCPPYFSLLFDPGLVRVVLFQLSYPPNL
jgi:hypothetical protein